jgi:hypothetical protein
MDLQLDWDRLSTKTLFFATPMYGGACAGLFAASYGRLEKLCAEHKINLVQYFLYNESLITRARNYCCDSFMRSGADHMVFVDSDIGFNPLDIIAMMAMQDQDEKYEIIGGPYPKKCISWEKIKHAVDKGVADENPSVLERFVGDFVFNPKQVEGKTEFNLREPLEVLEIGTGFMMITKKAMQKFADSYPQYMYKPDHVRTKDFDGSREIMMFFQAEVDPATKRYLSEDYWFCQKAQAIGIKTWICPWMQLQHVGSYIFGGTLIDLASIGASMTADPSKLGK